MTKVTAILPSYNVARYIGKCLESVIDQSLKEIEIFCIDAGSTDGTAQIIQDLCKKDDRIRYILSEKKSYGYQVNLGIEEASGEYIAIIETDDFIDGKMFEELYEFASKNDADVVKAPYYDHYRDDDYHLCYFAERLNTVLPDACFSLKEHGEMLAFHASVWSGLYRTAYLRDRGIRFVEAEKAGYVDVGFRIESLIRTDRIAWYREPFYYYRTYSQGSSTIDFQLPVMIKRWEEAHEVLSGCEDDYVRYYAKYLIFDEFLNTLAYIGRTDVSEEDMYRIHQNLCKTPDEVIIDSPVLREKLKKRIIRFKEDPLQYYMNANRFLLVKQKLIKAFNNVFPKGTKFRNLIKRILVFKDVK